MNTFGRTTLICALLLLSSAAVLVGCKRAGGANLDNQENAAPYVHAATAVAAGRYLVTVGGCNDCHTPGYMQTEGQVPETEWLTGSPVGFRGPWGTTYPSNLRLMAQALSEDEWVEMLHTRKAMPPMPWMNVNKMSEQDARAIYRFIKSLGPKGERMPAIVSPDQEPSTPYIVFEPQHMERLQLAAPPAGTKAAE